MTTNNILQDRAMLVTLTISAWTNRKYDKKVSGEVEAAHAAKDAGRYNKVLVDKAALDPITKIGSAARAYHYAVTLPWGENGERLLPSMLFLDYADKLRGFKAEYQQRVRAFVAAYPRLVNDTRLRLGTMYDAMDYPPVEDIRTKFDMTTDFSPIPAAQDFRVNLNEDYVDSIRQEIEDRTSRRQREAVKACWFRVREVVAHIHERLADKDNEFRDSLITNAEKLIALLPALNITNDPELVRIGDEVKTLLVHPDRLRTDLGVRSETAAKAEAILAKMQGLM